MLCLQPDEISSLDIAWAVSGRDRIEIAESATVFAFGPFLKQGDLSPDLPATVSTNLQTALSAQRAWPDEVRTVVPVQVTAWRLRHRIGLAGMNRGTLAGLARTHWTGKPLTMRTAVQFWCAERGVHGIAVTDSLDGRIVIADAGRTLDFLHSVLH
jgi:hypothetical protein